MADEPTPAQEVHFAGECTGPGPCDTHPIGEKKNWVTEVGGLPTYIRAIAHALMRQGHGESRAIATAIATVKRWAAGGGHVTDATKARAAKAVAEWEAKKAAHSGNIDVFTTMVAFELDEIEGPVAPTHAGLVLKAADTGRILMLQRALDEDDPHGGKWEFPGGAIEPDDLTTLHGGIREWQEEVGQPFPKGGAVAATWTAPNGTYQGHVVTVPNEDVIELHTGRQMLNPDDPDGDASEQVAWWDPDDAAANPALREEVKTTPWEVIKSAGALVPNPIGEQPDEVDTEGSGEDDEDVLAASVEAMAGEALDAFCGEAGCPCVVEGDEDEASLAQISAEFANDEFAWWDAYAKPPAPPKPKKTAAKKPAQSSSSSGSGFNAKHPRDPFGKFAPLGQGAGYQTRDNQGQQENAKVKTIQKALQHLGISVGPEGADGMLGPHTAHGISLFQKAHGLHVTGSIDEATFKALKDATTSTKKAKAAKHKVARVQRIPGLLPQAPGMLPDSAVPRQPVPVSMPGYRPNPIIADGTSFEGVPFAVLAGAPEGHVYHFKHGWIPVDHPAARRRNANVVQVGRVASRDGDQHEITQVDSTHATLKNLRTRRSQRIPLDEVTKTVIRKPDEKQSEPVMDSRSAIEHMLKRLHTGGMGAEDMQFVAEAGIADGDEYVQPGDEFAGGSSNRWIRKRGNKWVIIQKGTGKVLQSHDSKESAERGFRAMMKSKYGGSVTTTTFGDETFAGGHEGHVYHFKHGWIPVGDHRDSEGHGLTHHEHGVLGEALRFHAEDTGQHHPGEARSIDETTKRLDAGEALHGEHDVANAQDALSNAADAAAADGDMRGAQQLGDIHRKLHAQAHGGAEREKANFATFDLHSTFDLEALIAAAVTEADPIQLSEDTGGGVSFKIPLILPTGVETGDRREFKAGGLTHRDLPIPLLWQRFTDDGHKQSSIVGRIDKVVPTKNGLGNAEGVFDTGEDAQEALRLVRGLFLRGVSGDVDKIDAEMSQGDDGKPKVVFDKGRLTAATLVAKPAFAECMIELPGDQEWENNMGRLREEGDAPKPLVAAGGPMTPPKAWFDNPNLSEPTHLTVTEDGRVFGHIAAWNQDHIGMPFQKPPRSRTDYAYFATSQVKTAEGDMVNVGQLTLAGGHADLSYTADMAIKHYDDTRSAVADVAIGEDSFGIWVAGAQRPDLSEAQVRAFRASDPSGDWRPINGNLELVACLQVNVPGFPIPRARVASGAVTALVAAGAPMVARHRPETTLEARVASLEAADVQRRRAIADEHRATLAAARQALVASTKQALVASADELAATEFDSPIFDDPDAGSEDMTGADTDDVRAEGLQTA